MLSPGDAEATRNGGRGGAGGVRRAPRRTSATPRPTEGPGLHFHAHARKFRSDRHLPAALPRTGVELQVGCHRPRPATAHRITPTRWVWTWRRPLTPKPHPTAAQAAYDDHLGRTPDAETSDGQRPGVRPTPRPRRRPDRAGKAPCRQFDHQGARGTLTTGRAAANCLRGAGRAEVPRRCGSRRCRRTPRGRCARDPARAPSAAPWRARTRRGRSRAPGPGRGACGAGRGPRRAGRRR